MFTKADQQGLWLLKTEVLDMKQSRHKWEIHCGVSHGFMSFEARRHHYDPLISLPTQSRPKRRKCNQICVKPESQTVHAPLLSSGRTLQASVSHWGIINLSSFYPVQKVLLSPQVTPFQKPFWSHNTKAEMCPLGQVSQGAFECSWSLLRPC